MSEIIKTYEVSGIREGACGSKSVPYWKIVLLILNCPDAAFDAHTCVCGSYLTVAGFVYVLARCSSLCFCKRMNENTGDWHERNAVQWSGAGRVARGYPSRVG